MNSTEIKSWNTQFNSESQESVKCASEKGK